MNKNIVIFGAGAHSHVIIDIIEKSNLYTIIGLIDSIREIGSNFNDYKIIGRQNNLVKLQEEYNFSKGIIALGDNYSRYIVEKEILAQSKSFEFINAIHPSVVIGKNVEIGYGNVFMPNVVINTSSKIGNHCIINTLSSLEHFSIMENYSSLSAGVTTGGFVHLKEFSAITLGVTIFDKITIGEHVVVGSGSLVTKDIPPFNLVYGSPAKIIRSRNVGDKYLK